MIYELEDSIAEIHFDFPKKAEFDKYMRNRKYQYSFRVYDKDTEK